MLSSTSLLLLFVFVCQCLCSVEWESSRSVSDAKRLRQLKKSTKATRNPCTCSEETQTCTCCARFNIEGKSTDEGCASFKIPNGRSRNQLVRYSFNFNDNTANQMAAPGFDPPPLCISIPNAVGLSVCAIFYDVVLQNGLFGSCLDIELRFFRARILVVQFDCLRVQISKGKFALVKPSPTEYPPPMKEPIFL